MNFFRKLGLTKQEIVIIGFLLCVFITGVLLNVFHVKPAYDFNYNEKDKLFEEKIKKSFTELEQQKLTDEQQRKADRLKELSDSLLALKDKGFETGVSNQKEFKLEKKININTAYAADLEVLPGVGEVMADRIIEYRDNIGSFKKVEDLMKVKGIGKKKFEGMKDYVTVE